MYVYIDIYVMSFTPNIFFCLIGQVANSNVRRNALLLLIDMFPLEDPNASKEENDILLDKQFVFLEKSLEILCSFLDSLSACIF